MTLLVQGYSAWPQTPWAQRPVAVALGIFDGVHLGHQALLGALTQCGQDTGCVTAVLTFDPHPVQVLRPAYAPQLLEPIDARISHMRRLGIQAVVVHPFSHETARIPAEAFVRDVLVGLMHVRHVIVGADSVFGYRRGGNVPLLRAMGQDLGFAVHPQAPVRVAGMVASSTKIREFVRRGAMQGAQELLGRPYRLYGALMDGSGCVEGSGAWRRWAPRAELVLAPGLYAASLASDSGARPAVVQVVHVGDDDERTVEVWICPVSGALQAAQPWTHLALIERLHALPVAACATFAPPSTQDLRAAAEALGRAGTEQLSS